MHTTHLTADHHGNRRILQWIAAIRFPVLRAEQDSVDMRTAAGQRGTAWTCTRAFCLFDSSATICD